MRNGIAHGFTGPVDNQRHPDSAFIVPSFRTPQGQIGRREPAIEPLARMVNAPILVRGRHSTVISCENHNRVFRQAELRKLGPDTAQTLVRRLKHPGKLHIILLLLHPPHPFLLMQLENVFFL